MCCVNCILKPKYVSDPKDYATKVVHDCWETCPFKAIDRDLNTALYPLIIQLG